MIKINLKYLSFFGFMIAVTPSFGQDYDDYLGAGHNRGITVITSSNSNKATGEKTIGGEGLNANKIEAARFFSQASFGENYASIKDFAQELDFEAWIDAQTNMPPNLMLPKLWEFNKRSERLFYEEQAEDDMTEYFGPSVVHFQYTWWDNIKKNPDQLRQRIAFALSQIFVISSQSQLGEYGEGLADYYDILLRHAFGNYEDLMLEVSLHPTMGFYLSHLNNPKTNEEVNLHPDENYAREIMQLFSIGLYELNIDGTRKTQNGEWIATYDNEHVKGLAKVFTGLGADTFEDWVKDEYPRLKPDFGADMFFIDKTVPLIMYEHEHESGTKKIVGDYIIPNGQTGMEDINEAINHIFNHDNVAPFVSYRLIQNLVKSNPTPAYIERVSSVFNNDGNGNRGNLAAVVKAILLDSEARECAAMQDPNHGKLREPVLRNTNVFRVFDYDSPDGYYWNEGLSYFTSTLQTPLHAPSVFNFYLPDHQPVGDFVKENINSPELQIHNTQTAIGYVNQANKWTIWQTLMWDWHESTPAVEIVYDGLIELADDPESLINRLDIIFTHGRMKASTRQIIKDAITPFIYGDFQEERAALALYLTLICPEYVVLK